MKPRAIVTTDYQPSVEEAIRSKFTPMSRVSHNHENDPEGDPETQPPRCSECGTTAEVKVTGGPPYCFDCMLKLPKPDCSRCGVPGASTFLGLTRKGELQQMTMICASCAVEVQEMIREQHGHEAASEITNPTEAFQWSDAVRRAYLAGRESEQDAAG